MTPKLSDYRKKFKFNINRNICDLSVRSITAYGDKFDFDVLLPTKGMYLQRGFVWTLEQKRELIMSIIKEVYIHKVTVIKSYLDYKDRKFIYKVIDGKQRISTILDFVNNKFAIVLNDGKFYLFSELPEDIRKCIEFYDIIADIGYEYPDQLISDEDKITWFEMINFAGTAQDIEHLKMLKK